MPRFILCNKSISLHYYDFFFVSPLMFPKFPKALVKTTIVHPKIKTNQSRAKTKKGWDQMIVSKVWQTQNED